MSLHEPDAFAAFVAGLPGTSLVEQWGSRVAKVGGKVFALVGLGGGNMAFKVSELSFAGLTELEGIGQAPYFAKGQWVSVAAGALGEAELADYLRQAHGLIAAKLPRKLRAELGL
ncbi:MAG: MmcQ/YjbR family DNA-binding protein [Devosia sp.]|nr:MmcQ/YjbR family DNA-binding protein [Devosia sp.]